VKYCSDACRSKKTTTNTAASTIGKNK
jgi:hypothetical protein